MAKKNPDDVMVARESGSADIDGVETTFVKGVTRVRRDHPLAKAHPAFFQEVENSLTYEVEAATDDPGEKRGAKK